jgi:hypothetical protein
LFTSNHWGKLGSSKINSIVENPRAEGLKPPLTAHFAPGAGGGLHTSEHGDEQLCFSANATEGAISQGGADGDDALKPG